MKKNLLLGPDEALVLPLLMLCTKHTISTGMCHDELPKLLRWGIGDTKCSEGYFRKCLRNLLKCSFTFGKWSVLPPSLPTPKASWQLQGQRQQSALAEPECSFGFLELLNCWHHFPASQRKWSAGRLFLPLYLFRLFGQSAHATVVINRWSSNAGALRSLWKEYWLFPLIMILTANNLFWRPSLNFLGNGAQKVLTVEENDGTPECLIRTEILQFSHEQFTSQEWSGN